jgi:DNA polymerase-3 subunit beta
VKLTFKADQLAAAVTWTARYAKPGHQVPILSGLLFQPLETDEDGGYAWTVTGYDYDHCATAALEPTNLEPLGVDDNLPERFVLHGRWLASLVAKLRGEVTLVVDDGQAVITSGRGRWTMPCMAAGEYPDLPADPPSIGTVAADALRPALEKVGVAATRDDVLPVLTTACVTANDGHLEIACTDRYRAARVFLTWLHKDMDPFLVDPAEFGQMLRDVNGEASILYDPDTNLTGIACGDRVLVSRGVDGKFPPVAQFFESPVGVHVTVSRAGLLEVLEQATVAADAATAVVLDFNADNRSLTLEAKVDVLSSDSSVEMDAAASATGWAAVKGAYLRDALRTIDTEYVTLGFKDEDGKQKPVQVTASGDDEPCEWVPDTTHQQLIMPIRYQR